MNEPKYRERIEFVMKPFPGETEVWTRCFLAALSSSAAATAASVADNAAELLASRQAARVKAAREAQAAARAKALRIGCFKDRSDHVLRLVLREPNIGGQIICAIPADLSRQYVIDPGDLIDDGALEPKPEKLNYACQNAVCGMFNWRYEDVFLTWAGIPEPDPDEILDVHVISREDRLSERVLDRSRITKDEWQKLRDAGLPIAKYEDAMLTWEHHLPDAGPTDGAES